MWQVSNDHPRLYLGDCWATLSGWLWSTPKAQRAIWYAYPLGRQVILCVSKTANSAPEWICHNFFSKLLRQHPRFPWTEKKDHYLNNTIADLIKRNPYGIFCRLCLPPPPLFNIKFSVGPQRARVLHNKIAPSLRPSPETLQSYAYYNQARSSFYYIIFAKAKTTTRFVVVGHLVWRGAPHLRNSCRLLNVVVSVVGFTAGVVAIPFDEQNKWSTPPS